LHFSLGEETSRRDAIARRRLSPRTPSLRLTAAASARRLARRPCSTAKILLYGVSNSIKSLALKLH
jgi:hypothetical protein